MNQILHRICEPYISVFDLLARVIEHNATYSDIGGSEIDGEELLSLWLPLFRTKAALLSALSALETLAQDPAEARLCAQYLNALKELE